MLIHLGVKCNSKFFAGGLEGANINADKQISPFNQL